MSGSSLGFTLGRTVTLMVADDASVSAAVDPDAPSLRILNLGPELVFVRVGTGPQSASTDDFPIMPGQPTVIGKGVGADTISAIAAVTVSTPLAQQEHHEEQHHGKNQKGSSKEKERRTPRALAPQALYVTTGHA